MDNFSRFLRYGKKNNSLDFAAITDSNNGIIAIAGVS